MAVKAKPSTRPIWSGRISIGLVNVPVRLYTMIRDESFSFRYVRKDDACPLKYERVCTLDKEVVNWEDVARGYEVKKGEFIVFSDEELEALRPSSDRRINIDKFVPFASVDRIYFDKVLHPHPRQERGRIRPAPDRLQGDEYGWSRQVHHAHQRVSRTDSRVQRRPPTYNPQVFLRSRRPSGHGGAEGRLKA